MSSCNACIHLNPSEAYQELHGLGKLCAHYCTKYKLAVHHAHTGKGILRLPICIASDGREINTARKKKARVIKEQGVLWKE